MIGLIRIDLSLGIQPVQISHTNIVTMYSANPAHHPARLAKQKAIRREQRHLRVVGNASLPLNQPKPRNTFITKCFEYIWLLHKLDRVAQGISDRTAEKAAFEFAQVFQISFSFVFTASHNNPSIS